MQILDIPLEGREDRDGLRAFYLACLEAAVEDGHDKIASIALRVRHIDPLAVLESIDERGVEHFYMEHRERGWAVAGAEAIAGIRCRGAGRFAEARAFVSQWDDHLICIGDPRLPLFGPLYFAAFPFFADSADEDFPDAHIFIPQWQVARQQDAYVAVANARIGPQTDIGPLVERLWSAWQRLGRDEYLAPGMAPPYRIVGQSEVGPVGAFETNVQRALAAIRAGRYHKIVLSRALDLAFDSACEPLRILTRLRERYPSCHVFSFQNEAQASLIGASPERLVSLQNGQLQTEAIAGSVRRGQSASEDARLAGQLLASAKDLHEHQLVIDSILRRLQQAGVADTEVLATGLFTLANVHHLRTPIRAQPPAAVHILDVAACLHPTPALGGSPRQPALEDIRAWEPFSRGLFGGLVGWFDARGNGELAVAIRCARIRGNEARILAGAGIVEGSVPGQECAETTLKMQALLQAIGHAGQTP